MNVTTPEQKKSGTSKLEEAVNKFEERFKQAALDENSYFLVILGEFDRETCDQIEKIYTDAGWAWAKCSACEDGGYPGLTSLNLHRS